MAGAGVPGIRLQAAAAPGPPREARSEPDSELDRVFEVVPRVLHQERKFHAVHHDASTESGEAGQEGREAGAI